MIRCGWYDWGTCHHFIQMFGHFILSKYTLAVTQQHVSCETTNNAGCLAVWIISESAFSWEASKQLVSVSGLGDPIWVASLKPPAATTVLLTSACSVSFRDQSALLSGWDKNDSHLAGREMCRLSIALLNLIGWESLFLSSWFHFWSRFHVCQSRCRCAWKHVQLAAETW